MKLPYRTPNRAFVTLAAAACWGAAAPSHAVQVHWALNGVFASSEHGTGLLADAAMGKALTLGTSFDSEALLKSRPLEADRAGSPYTFSNGSELFSLGASAMLAAFGNELQLHAVARDNLADLGSSDVQVDVIRFTVIDDFDKHHNGSPADMRTALVLRSTALAGWQVSNDKTPPPRISQAPT